MTEGRFEKGRWVEENEGDDIGLKHQDCLEDRLAAAKKNLGKGLDEILSVGQELVTTEEGRKHLGRSMDQTCNQIMGALEDTARKANDFINTLLDQRQKR